MTKVAQPSRTNASFLIPADTSSAFAAQESLRIGRYLAKPSVTKVAHGEVAFSVEEICAALGLEQLRGVLINEDAISLRNTGRDPGMLRRPCREVDRAGVGLLGGYSGRSPESGCRQPLGCGFPPPDNNRTSTSQKRVAWPRTNKFPDGRRSVP